VTSENWEDFVRCFEVKAARRVLGLPRPQVGVGAIEIDL
jgi:hypothetical protein